MKKYLLLVVLVLVSGCARDNVETMPSDVLDRSDPGADTSKNPIVSCSETGNKLYGQHHGGRRHHTHLLPTLTCETARRSWSP